MIVLPISGTLALVDGWLFLTDKPEDAVYNPFGPTPPPWPLIQNPKETFWYLSYITQRALRRYLVRAPHSYHRQHDLGLWYSTFVQITVYDDCKII